MLCRLEDCKRANTRSRWLLVAVGDSNLAFSCGTDRLGCTVVDNAVSFLSDPTTDLGGVAVIFGLGGL